MLPNDDCQNKSTNNNLEAIHMSSSHDYHIDDEMQKEDNSSSPWPRQNTC